LIEAGTRVQTGWKLAAERAGLRVHVSGIPPLSHISFEYPNGQAIGTLFTQLMLARGFLASKAFYASYAHQDEQIENYLDATSDVFADLAEAIRTQSVEKELKGPVAHAGFHRLT
jgi:glutamate-1-semialdehyde aminotransferase